MTGAVAYTDYFVVVTGATPRQTKAIAEEIVLKLKPDHRPARVEGEREGEWILLDYLDVVVHISTPEARGFYRLERLWGDVPRLALAEGDDPAEAWARLTPQGDSRQAEEESA